ncbi:DUF3137 domain-containing protein [Shewanella sp. 1CM18E]|uniref:DUF3137 domain-containing protein n=1 Tax=Shewanella sp. 1CM18E TaxID=2929169 RepID=UPI0020C132FF|nr:DUF3137 domain-containing protein [Shewanella sp. 1CM18E]MCK8046051.1 DUF3137 domain-containing protein [Shewanella sp. 1CM18E]
MNPMEFNIPADDKHSFAEYFQQHIEPKWRSYEAKRIPIVAKYQDRRKISQPISYIAMFAGLFGFVGIFYALAIANDDAFFLVGGLLLFVVAMIVGVGVNFWAGSETFKFRDGVIKVIHPLVLRYFGESFMLNPKNLPEIKAYQRYGILPKYDRGYFQDSVKGEYKGVAFLVRELNLSVANGTEDNKTKYKTIFDGIVIEFDTFKKFNGETQVRLDKGTLGNKYQAFKQDLSRVKLEDVNFERQFEVYSSDQVEARYLLTPTTMARFQSLSNFYGSQLEACFKGGKLFMKIATKHNYFESKLDILKPLDFSHDIEQLFRELNQIFALIDALKLDDKTGL